MKKLLNRNIDSMRQWVSDYREFFNNSLEVNSRQNWELLHYMSLTYMLCIGIYLFVMCPIMGIRLQAIAVLVFMMFHIVFTLVIFMIRGRIPSVRAVNLTITLFAAEILGLAGFLEIVIFTDRTSFLFPLCLILMTQIYTRPVSYRVTEIMMPAAAYLILCWEFKEPGDFLLDVISILIALGISGVSIFTIMGYKMRAFRTRVALEKMCTLDPMTGVNNKSTFEFRVEDFLRHSSGGSNALAICDLDDFKNINDTYGHSVGDEVLKRFSGQLHSIVDDDENIIAGRFGGDEFVIFFKTYGSRDAVLKKASELSSISGFDFAVTCSLGIAFASSEKKTFRQLFDSADKCLYSAKMERSGIICLDDDEQKEADENE